MIIHLHVAEKEKKKHSVFEREEDEREEKRQEPPGHKGTPQTQPERRCKARVGGKNLLCTVSCFSYTL